MAVNRLAPVGAAPLLAVLILVAAIVCEAQAPTGWSEAGPELGPDWGTDATQVLTLHALGFVASTSMAGYSVLVDSTGVFRVGSPSTAASFYSALVLPEGALVTSIAIDGCDETSIGYLSVAIFKNPKGPTPGYSSLVGGMTGDTPGCQSFEFFPVQPFTIDNEGLSYAVEVQIESAPSGNPVRFKAVRIYYNLQVSPAPASATFVDVPTGHWAFRHIEALAASGITAGCGGGAFCPEEPLTRAQMAVFLAKALGLHWAP